jgi:hypothetical protein
METKIVLELITSILEALSGYIVGKGFRDKKYTYSRIIIVASIISIIFFLMHSCYEILFGQKEFIRLSFLISVILFIVILFILLMLKALNGSKK